MNTKKPHVYIVIPVYNRLNFTKKCLAAIHRQNYKHFTVVLVDDGSTDGTAKYVSRRFPEVVIISGNGKWWWTRSMYEGVKYAIQNSSNKKDYVLEMNND